MGGQRDASRQRITMQVNEQPYMVPKPPPEDALLVKKGRGLNKVEQALLQRQQVVGAQ